MAETFLSRIFGSKTPVEKPPFPHNLDKVCFLENPDESQCNWYEVVHVFIDVPRYNNQGQQLLVRTRMSVPALFVPDQQICSNDIYGPKVPVRFLIQSGKDVFYSSPVCALRDDVSFPGPLAI